MRGTDGRAKEEVRSSGGKEPVGAKGRPVAVRGGAGWRGLTGSRGRAVEAARARLDRPEAA